jgi:KUP system potassium uptake protein
LATSQLKRNQVTTDSLLITLGLICGGIGTSPLYVLNAVIGEQQISELLVMGVLSAIFWTLTLQTTIKYIILTLRVDNKGEGGIFSLYTLVRRTRFKWLLAPAIIGGSALLADGVISPSISVSAAVEGLWYYNKGINTIAIVISLLCTLFFFQQFGNSFIGKLFGPLMTVWFLMIGILGTAQLVSNWSVLAAFNPMYAYELLVRHPEGFVLLGGIFLCTSGAETIYSDLGHAGKKSIRTAWTFVKPMLLLSYFGQGAWLLKHQGEYLASFTTHNPFYAIMSEQFLPVGIAISIIATIVASQALISGSFTLINEAIRLNLWPKIRVKHPSVLKGQLYIPAVNWIMMLGCVSVVLYFKVSTDMQHAYGLAIALTMLMTTTLLNFYMHMKRYNPYFIYFIITLFLVVEIAFLAASLSKFLMGGWITIGMALLLSFIMTIYHFAKKIRNRYVEMVRLSDHMQKLIDLSHDESLSKYATHLVYMTSASNPEEIESKIIYSILQKRPKKADIYWFLHVDVMDEPYRMEYKVKHISEDDIIRVDFRLGFRIAPKINLLFRKVVEDLVLNKEVDITSGYRSLNKNNVIGDFKFVVLEKFLSYDNDLPALEKFILNIYFLMNYFSLSEAKAFGLDSSSVKIEKFPLVIAEAKEMDMHRLS